MRIEIKGCGRKFCNLFSLINEQTQIKEQMPVNFLTDGKIIKGYNEAGRLVAVYDMYENYAVIEYEKSYVAYNSGYRIARVYDNKNQQIIFTYTPQNYLSSITDTHGRRTEYAYDDTKLARVKYATGEENSTQTIYKNGLVAELRSGNNVVRLSLLNGEF